MLSYKINSSFLSTATRQITLTLTLRKRKDIVNVVNEQNGIGKDNRGKNGGSQLCLSNGVKSPAGSRHKLFSSKSQKY